VLSRLWRRVAARPWARPELRAGQPAAAVLLAASFLALFAVTAALTRRHRAHESELAARFDRQGAEALRSGRPDQAIAAFRTAIFYSRQADTSRFQLAQALLAAGRPQEARPYLDLLWQHDPSRGIVNLELARMFAAEGASDDAVRHYQGAIHGLWEGGQEGRRREAQWELIGYLKAADDVRRAVAELVTLAASLREDDAPAHAEVASWLLDLGEPRLALASFRQALSADAASLRARLGVGAAAAGVGDWRTVRDVLRRVPREKRDPASAARLATAELVLSLDPWAPRLSIAERARRAREAARALAHRLACDSAAAAPLRQELAALAPRLRTSAVRDDPGGIDAVFALALRADALEPGCPDRQPADHAVRALALRRRAEEADGDG
jgi:tetratricopeptide (TPR) repeat protein